MAVYAVFDPGTGINRRPGSRQHGGQIKSPGNVSPGPVYFSWTVSKSDCKIAIFSAMAFLIFPFLIQPRIVSLFISMPRIFSPVTIKSHKRGSGFLSVIINKLYFFIYLPPIIKAPYARGLYFYFVAFANLYNSTIGKSMIQSINILRPLYQVK